MDDKTPTAEKGAPYVVKRDGMVHDRATGKRVGMVRLVSGDGWTGYLLGPDYPTNPWQQTKVDAGMAGRRWSVARAVWEAHIAAPVTCTACGEPIVKQGDQWLNTTGGHCMPTGGALVRHKPPVESDAGDVDALVAIHAKWAARNPRSSRALAQTILDSDWLAARDAEVRRATAERTAPLVRRAVNDPGSFVKRGPDYDGEPYGERLDQWQARAIAAAVEQAAAP